MAFTKSTPESRARLPHKAIPRGRVKALPMDWKYVQQLVQSVREDCITGFGLHHNEYQTYAVILIGFSTGLRATDMRKLTWDTFIGRNAEGTYPYPYAVIYENKKNHLKNVPSQRIPLFRSFQALILELFHLVRPQSLESYIFNRNPNKPQRGRPSSETRLTAPMICRMFESVMAVYEVRHATPIYTMMRCSWARALYEDMIAQGFGEEKALLQTSRIMNHSSIAYTATYIGLGFFDKQVIRVIQDMEVTTDNASLGAYTKIGQAALPEPEPIDWEKVEQADRLVVGMSRRNQLRLGAFLSNKVKG